ncbi:hypothetical protein GCM10011297_33630 [Bacterioplanes sanyensis]|nr:hypothetical protein GCM10011297_33630 [Bacterioplanes sanyensis]
MKLLAALMAALALSGCATVNTIAPENNRVKISINGYDSHCRSIPRIYSGVAHNLCTLAGQPNVSANAKSNLQWLLVDTALSAAADTIMVPYTVMQQIEKGNIQVNR